MQSFNPGNPDPKHLYASLNAAASICRYFIFSFKMYVMLSASFSFGIGLSNTPLSRFHGRRRRSWVSFITTGCHNGQVVYVVYRCPVVNGMAHVNSAWQHRVVPA
ncbi:MAG: hypothetical protein ABIN36_17490 [Ferruginibacter sp.]